MGSEMSMKYYAEHVFMIRERFFFVILVMMFSQTSLLAQQMAVGSWGSHFSYAEGRHLTVGNGTVFCAAAHGLFSVKEDILEVIDKNTGLSGVSVSALKFFEEAQLLVIGYQDGIIDLVYSDHMVSIQTISNIEMMTSKAINDFVNQGNRIYLATDMGIALLDLTTEEVSDFYSEIGPNGAVVSVQDLFLHDDSLFAISNEGVMAADLNMNLFDFNNWLFYPETSNLKPTRIFKFSEVLAFLNEDYLFAKSNEVWDTLLVLPEVMNQVTSTNQNTYFLSNQGVYEMVGGAIVPLIQDRFSSGHDLIVNGEVFWIADGDLGLINITKEMDQQVRPNGPMHDDISGMDIIDGALYVFYAPDPDTASTESIEGYSIFREDQWEAHKIEGFNNISGAVKFRDQLFLSSHGQGIYDYVGTKLLTDPELKKASITDMWSTDDFLWFTNYMSEAPLGSFDGENISFLSSAQLGTTTPLSLQGSSENVLWIKNSSIEYYGVTAFNPSKNLIWGAGPSSGIPSTTVNAIEMSLDDELWMATKLGPSYFSDASFISEEAQAYVPYFENEVLFEDENVTAMAFDGGDRLWLGTERGLWTFSKTLQAQIHHFTSENSFLPSNTIVELAYDGQSGVLFVLTDEGLVSYQTNSSAPQSSNIEVKIYPNPITASYEGDLIISGVVGDALIKFATIDGTILYETQANGSTASWDLIKFNGERLLNGIYLVFVTDLNGTEKWVGKFAIIR